MTFDEFTTLTEEEVQRALAEQAGRDPVQVALDRRVPAARLVATQLKYAERAQEKLPSYAAAGCILPPRAFEQASSEACAMSKRLISEEGRAGSVLDLTCGLGVDAWALSRRFERVVTLERDPVLAEVARWNFRRLGATHIEVVNTPAEEYLQQPDLHFDAIYADPDRRNAEGRKLVRLEDCSPNIVALLPRLREVAPRLCVKNSPLFDVEEARRIFGPCRIEVLSVGDECKEVVVDSDSTVEVDSVTAVAVGKGRFEVMRGTEIPPAPEEFTPERYRYLVLTDVALRKAELARLRLAGKADIWTENGFGFATEAFDDPMVRLEEIEHIEPYDPRRLKQQWKGSRAEVLKREFPLAQEELMRRTGLRAGSDLRLAFTCIRGHYWTLFLKTRTAPGSNR